jgi:hypothetical protein
MADKSRIKTPTTIGKISDIFKPATGRVIVNTHSSSASCSGKRGFPLVSKYEGASQDDLLLLSTYVLSRCDF